MSILKLSVKPRPVEERYERVHTLVFESSNDPGQQLAAETAAAIRKADEEGRKMVL